MSKIANGVAASVIAIALGGAHAVVMKRMQEAPATSEHVPADPHAATAAAPPASAVRELKPLITNLAGPANAWVRIELALVYGAAPPKEEDKLVSEFGNDTIAYLRTLQASQLEGRDGLDRLRVDLIERANIRFGGKIQNVLIETLVVQ